MSIKYYIVARKWATLYEQPLAFGVLYGLALYAVMNAIVVPLSAAGGGGGQVDRFWIALSIVIHMFLIGVAIAFFTRRAMYPITSSPDY